MSTFYKIIIHRKLPNHSWEFKLFWGTGLNIRDPINAIKEYYKLNFSACARENDILNTQKWKWAILLTKNNKKFISMTTVFDAHTNKKLINTSIE